MIITKSNQQWNSTKLNGRNINEIIEEWELKIKKEIDEYKKNNVMINENLNNFNLKQEKEK